ncbi:MAG: hypothetical protein ACI90V_001214 [Bacillariaceae sp.]|jgi:hypothetical protein
MIVTTHFLISTNNNDDSDNSLPLFSINNNDHSDNSLPLFSTTNNDDSDNSLPLFSTNNNINDSPPKQKVGLNTKEVDKVKRTMEDITTYMKEIPIKFVSHRMLQMSCSSQVLYKLVLVILPL